MKAKWNYKKFRQATIRKAQRKGWRITNSIKDRRYRHRLFLKLCGKKKGMSLITDFVQYCGCYEIPRNYAVWSAVGLMAASVNRRVYVMQGDIAHHANMYITLVGKQGIKKSTSKDFAQSIFSQVFPNLPVAASVQSREDIIKFMASADGIRTYTNEDGAAVEYHPYMLFINELENFLSFNIPGMVSFLTDIYDRKYFDSSTIKRNLEKIPNPCINILACVTPKWLIDKLRGSVITGGFCRRMVFVYELQDPKTMIFVPRPVITPAARAAEQRVIAHLSYIKDCAGQFTFTAEATQSFDAWYILNKRNLPDDPLMEGYRQTKDVQLLKLCMLIHLAQPGCLEMPMVITPALLELGLAMLNEIEINMPKLSIAAGKNEFKVPQQNILDYVERKGGVWPEKFIMRDCDQDLTPMEMISVLRHMKDTGLLEVVTWEIEGTKRSCLATPRKRKEMMSGDGNGSLDKTI